MRHLLNLDGWRGGLALIVAIAHVAQTYRQDASPLFGYLAFASVLGFFAISGYLIAQSLKAHDWRQFAIRRVDRLLPPFLFSLALCGVLFLAAPAFFESGTKQLSGTARESFSLNGLLPTVFFLNGFVGTTLDSNGPLWSLSYEVWYYVIAALLVYRQRTAGCALLLILTILQPWLAAKGIFFAVGFVAGWHLSPARHQSGGPLAWTGHFSYTLYVTHFPILLFCFGAGVPMLIAAGAAFAFAAIVGPRIERVRLSQHLRYSTLIKLWTISLVPTNLKINRKVN